MMYTYIKKTYQLRHVSIVHSSNTRGRVFIRSLYHTGGHILRVFQNSSRMVSRWSYDWWLQLVGFRHCDFA